MLSEPAVLALNLVSLAVAGMLLGASVLALRVLRGWNMADGSEHQLRLERQSELSATIMAWGLTATTLSLLLFVYTAEALSTRIHGAMCATGVLNASPWGWPTLALKIALLFGASAWLVLHRSDIQSPHYPLVRAKQMLILALTPLACGEATAQLLFFSGLDPEVITSCCGALFTPEGSGVAATITAVPPGWALSALVVTGALALGSGLLRWLVGRAGILLALASLAAFIAALVGLISFIAPYVYEHPQHHCPFCLLKSGHDYMGYWLYLPLFLATIAGIGAGVLAPWRQHPSLAAIVATEGRRLAATSTLLFALFYLVTAAAIARSGLSMQGVWW